MQELIGQFLIQFRGAYRFRWYALAIAWAVAVVGWVVVTIVPDVYEAHARVYVDTESVLKPLLNGLAVNTDVTSRVNMMARVIMGRPNLERVARETDLSARAHNPQELSKLITRLSQQVTLESGNGSNVYSLSYLDKDPVIAQRVVQHLLDAFVENTLGTKHADSGSAQKFLEKQISEYETRLHEAEERLAEFKRTNVGLMPGQTGDYYTRLQASLAKLQDLQSRARLASEKRTEIARQLSGEEPTFGLFASSDSSSSSSPIDKQIAEYQRQLDQLLLQYTDKHPKVVALRATMAQLEAQKSADRNKPREAPPVPQSRSDAASLALDINPVYQSLRIDLSRTDVELAELRQQIGEEEATVKELRARVNTAPETEAQLAQLNRDYDVTKAQHQALLQRLDSARLSEQADSSGERGRFRIIEPVTRPLVPIGPNRTLLMSAVLGVALALGGAVAVVLNQLMPVFLSRAMLASATGLPVLGAISFSEPSAKLPLLQRDAVRLGMAAASLLVAYVAGIGLVEPLSRLVHALTG